MNHAFVAGSGVINAVGGDSKMVNAAVKAGLNATQETDLFNRQNRPVKMCSVPERFFETFEPAENYNRLKNRILMMCEYSIRQLISNTKLVQPTPLFLCLPESSPNYQFKGASDLLSILVERIGETIVKNDSRLFAIGRVGSAYAIDHAMRYMAATKKDLVIVGGVESYHDPARLEQLDIEGRLSVSNSIGGFTPGEAAGFILLASPALQRRLNKCWLKIHRPGFASEEGHLYSDRPNMGNGLTEALRSALGCFEKNTSISRLYSSMNGESFWSKELGIAMIRCQKDFSENASIEHPADCFGDIGAAYCTTVLAMRSQDPSLSNECIVLSADGEQRAAMGISA